MRFAVSPLPAQPCESAVGKSGLCVVDATRTDAFDEAQVAVVAHRCEASESVGRGSIVDLTHVLHASARLWLMPGLHC